MLMLIAVIAAILWFVGLLTSYTLGGYIHVLIVIAAALVIFKVVTRGTSHTSISP